ncbi:hypothetical protein [Bartonella sp. AR 15-3]|uniref:hypothetical protein n=1 Tax=Bartonella sp. AR 15-3 TaxID=545617 RepID=UPI0001F4BCCA|nr:hypothetical protein [Bartonella sp. AR 15-3]OPB31422.1 hypothetical protein BAR153v2_003640 [Bartonella sp. AR 15-3]CBI78657.1 hypothetical protein BAR15_20008 [Bartonella sp. AR 15-3]
MPDNGATQNANNQLNSILLQPLFITSCYEEFSDDITWFNFHNITPFDIKLHSVSGVYCQKPRSDINWEHTSSWPEVFLSVGQFNAPCVPYCHNNADRIYFISPPEAPETKVLLQSINIPAHTKCFVIIGMQFWADISNTCIASIKLTFQFSPTYDFTKTFNTNIFLERMFLRFPKEEAKRIQSSWDEMEYATDRLKAYQLRNTSFNMQTAYYASRIIPEISL